MMRASVEVHVRVHVQVQVQVQKALALALASAWASACCSMAGCGCLAAATGWELKGKSKPGGRWAATWYAGLRWVVWVCVGVCGCVYSAGE